MADLDRLALSLPETTKELSVDGRVESLAGLRIDGDPGCGRDGSRKACRARGTPAGGEYLVQNVSNVGIAASAEMQLQR
jgi:hypothetical protein